MEAPTSLFPWYDSNWLTKFVKAKAIVRAARPQSLEAFVHVFEPLHTRSDFKERVIERAFDHSTLNEIRRAVASSHRS